MTSLATDNSVYSTVANNYDAEPLEFVVNATFDSVLSNASAFDVTDDVTYDVTNAVSTATKMAAINGTNLAWTGDDEIEIAYDNTSVPEGAQHNRTAQYLHNNTSAISEPSDFLNSLNSFTISDSISDSEFPEVQNSTPSDDFLFTTSSDNSTSRLLLNVLPTSRSGANATFHLTSVANNNFTFSNTTAETRTLAPQPKPTSTLASDIPNVIEDPVAPSTKSPTPAAREPSSTDVVNFLPEFPEVKTYKPKDPADLGNAIGQMEEERKL